MSELTLFDQPAVLPSMTTEQAREHVRQIKLDLQNVRNLLLELYEQEGWRALGYDAWRECVITEFNFTQSHVYELLAAAKVDRNISDLSETAIPLTHLTPIAQSKLQPEEQREVMRQAIETAPNGKVTAAHVERTVQTYKQEARQAPPRKYDGPQVYTMTQWQALSEYERVDLLQATGTTKFNETNENVEWALWTWNPITGCLHNCAYCYARDIANRFYSYLPDDERFAPAFYPERLSCPANTRVPDLTQIDDLVRRIGLRNVFTCSMADLFGKWVPSEWIHAVLKQVADNPQWTFLFLTKFPIRMAEFDFPPNTWIGTTVDTQYAVERAEKAFRKIRAGGYAGVAWLSCEPMLERLTFGSLDMFDWVVMGGSSKSTQTPEFKPPFEWINHLYNQAKVVSLPVYMKTNLGIEQREREYPV